MANEKNEKKSKTTATEKKTKEKKSKTVAKNEQVKEQENSTEQSKLQALFQSSKPAVLPAIDPTAFLIPNKKEKGTAKSDTEKNTTSAPLRPNRESHGDSSEDDEGDDLEDRHFPKPLKRQREEKEQDFDFDSEAEAEKEIAKRKIKAKVEKQHQQEVIKKEKKEKTAAKEQDISEDSSDSDDDGDGTTKKKKFPKAKDDEEKLKRTIFVGNVNVTCTKLAGYRELKAKFTKYGKIDTIRFRSMKMENPMSRKKAFIQGKFDSAVDSLNAYVVFENEESVAGSLVENGSLLQGKHIRVDAATSEGKVDPKRSVFIGNLPLKITEESVWTHFSQCGEVSAVRLVRDKATSFGKGFGYVEFKDKSAVSIALALNSSKFLERELRVMPCKNELKKKGKGFEGERAKKNSNNKKDGFANRQKKRQIKSIKNKPSTSDQKKLSRKDHKDNKPSKGMNKDKNSRTIAKPTYTAKEEALRNELKNLIKSSKTALTE